jgi:ribosomal protein S18 acetylase RimI-like enzyme
MLLSVFEADLSQPEHGAACLALLDAYAREDTGGGQPLSAFVRANLVDELSKRDTVHVILGYADGAPAGLMICIEGFSSFACKPLINIHDVIVLPEYRGRGLFRRMLQELEKVAARLGCCKLTLEVLEGNQAALAAYRAAGFDGYQLDPAMGKALFWQKKL